MAPKLSSGMTLKRIHREIADIKKEDLGGIEISPSTDNLFLWSATIPGQDGSPYEGGSFKTEIVIPNDYPFSAPKVTFVTRIYHMNISDRGSVCIDILKQNWSPALSIFKVILSLSSLLTDPNPKDPLVPSIATEYVRNRAQHDKTAKHWTELYARPGAQPTPLPAPSAQSFPGLYFNMPIFPSHLVSSRRTRPSPSTRSPMSSSTPRTASEPIEIDDSDDDGASSSASTGNRSSAVKRKRDDNLGSDRTPKRGRPSDASVPASSSRGDVIVIED